MLTTDLINICDVDASGGGREIKGNIMKINLHLSKK